MKLSQKRKDVICSAVSDQIVKLRISVAGLLTNDPDSIRSLV